MKSTPLRAAIMATSKLMSPSAPQVLGLIGRKSVETSTLEDAIKLDPVLTVKVIAHANHSFYARRAPVSSVRAALVRIGAKASSDLLLKLLIETTINDNGGPLAHQIWQSATTLAALSRLLARHSRGIDPTDAYTAGLCHNLGKLGMLAIYRSQYSDLVIDIGGGPKLAAAERTRWGIDHAAVGAGVLAHHRVPSVLVGGVARQFRSNLALRDWQTPGMPIAALLQLSMIALHMDLLDQPKRLCQHRLARRLDLHADMLADLRERLRQSSHADEAQSAA